MWTFILMCLFAPVVRLACRHETSRSEFVFASAITLTALMKVLFR